jgi:hypothetical protein
MDKEPDIIVRPEKMGANSLRIKKAGTYKMHNEEHFQFMTEFINEANAAGIPNLIPAKFAEFMELYDKEDLLLEGIHKSPLTEKIEKADTEREIIFCGFRDMVKAMQYHYEPDKKEAALNLMLVLNVYGNLSDRNYAEETGMIYNFIQDMTGKYSSDVATLGLEGWITQLGDKNQLFSELIMERTRQKGEKNKFTMTEIKAKMDVCYGDIVRYLEAMTVIKSDHGLEVFFNTINSNVDRYKNTIAQREGKAAAAAAKKGEQEKETPEE